ncbi:MAG: hypothetical protein ACRD27_09190 [Terracidiphilus sp.]
MCARALGAASLNRFLATLSALFSIAAESKLTVATQPVPLAEVEQAWGRVEKGRRIVFTV